MKKIEIEISDETECILSTRLAQLSQQYTKERAYGMLLDELIQVCDSPLLLLHTICMAKREKEEK